MKVTLTQKEYNAFLKKASEEVEQEILSLLPSESSFHIFHVYKDAGKKNGYKRYKDIYLNDIKGVTFLILKHNNQNYVYTAHCHSYDTYSRIFGRKEVLSKLSKDVHSKFKSDHTDFIVPCVKNLSQRQQEDALINFKVALPLYVKHLKFKPKGRTATCAKQFIKALGGVPLLLKDAWFFIEENGSIDDVQIFEKIKDFDPSIHWDKEWKDNLSALIQKVMDKELTFEYILDS